MTVSTPSRHCLNAVLARLVQVLLLLVSLPALAQDPEIVLGALEEVPGVYIGEASSFRVRVLFSRKPIGWSAFKSACSVLGCLAETTAEYPQEVTWFIGLDGREIGQVRARTPKDFRFYSHIGLQDIVTGKVPVVGQPSYEYGNFATEKLHRPLVAVSRSNFSDPSNWKPASVTPALQDKAMTLLRGKFPKLCKEGHSKEKPLVPLSYGPNNLSIRAHRSNGGWLVMTVGVKSALYCEPAAGDGYFDAQAFAVDSAGRGQYLGAGLTLIDAGDYDQDGQSEVVFALVGYNRGGYVLFSNNFANQARFEFGFH